MCVCPSMSVDMFVCICAHVVLLLSGIFFQNKEKLWCYTHYQGKNYAAITLKN